jgi:hypothetical protein
MIDLHTPPTTQLAAARRMLAKVEARRALRHPVLLISFGYAAFMAYRVLSEPEGWSTYHYAMLLSALAPIVGGTIATANLISLRARPDQAFAAGVPLDGDWRRQAQLLAGFGPTIAWTVVVVAFGLGALHWGGPSVGDVHAQTLTWSAPELGQWILLVPLSWAFGCALARLVPNRVFGLVVAFLVGVIIVGLSWMFQGQPYVALVQTQPFGVELGTTVAPSEAPPDWVLTAPGEDQAQWEHVVRSQPVAAGHDVFLVGLTLASSAVLWTGRRRWELLAGGVGLALAGVAAQTLVGIA